MTVDITTKPDAVVKNDDNRLVDDSLSHFYRAMLCICGTSHGSVSVCLSVSVCHKSEFYYNG